MITPTLPAAISPHDVVRIYVPPAPPDEVENNFKKLTQIQSSPTQQSASSKTTPIKDRRSNMSASRTSLHSNSELTNGSGGTINGRSNSSNRNSIISCEATPVRRSLHRSDEDLMSNFNIELMRHNGQRSTSSSRRGSLSRKSPPAVLETDFGLMECAHIKARRRSSEIDCSMGIQLNSSNENLTGRHYTTIVDTHKSNNSEFGDRISVGFDGKKKMTSFEELAKMDAINNHMTKSDIQYETSKSYSSTGRHGTLTYSYGNKLINDGADTTTVHYKQFDGTTDVDYETLNHRPNDTDTSSVKYEMFSSSKESANTARTPFNRFYSADEDDDRIKSSDESSSSPNSKSVLNTPVNETVPLLVSSPTSAAVHSHHHHNRKLSIDEDDYDDDDDNDAEISPTAATPIMSPNSPPTKHPFSPTYTTKTFVPNQSSSSSSSMHEKQSSVAAVRPSRIPLYHAPMSPASDLNSVLPPIEISSSHAGNRLRSPMSPSSDYGVAGVANFDNRIAVPLGGAYEFNRNRQNSSKSKKSAANSTDMNKIRIKINQNQRH